MESTFSDDDLVENGSWKTKKIGFATIMFYISNNTIELASLRVARGNRKQGAARQAMLSLLAEADKRRLTVKLLASPLDKRTNLTKLVQFYQNLGFQIVGRGNPAGDPIMVRQPSQKH